MKLWRQMLNINFYLFRNSVLIRNTKVFLYIVYFSYNKLYKLYLVYFVKEKIFTNED